jgi:ATP phosphoribosyltransferase
MLSLSGMMHLSLVVSAMGLTLLVLSSWRLRTTTIGRSFLGFILVAACSPIFQLSAAHTVLSAVTFNLLTMAFDLALAAAILRLACQIANDSAKLPLAVESFLVGTPALVLFSGEVVMASLWISFAFAFASIQIRRMPLRSWDGFGAALSAISGLMFIPALLSLWSLTGVSSSWIGTAMPFAMTVLAIGLFLGLPRLGLLSSDRVRHGSLIEAMCDGVSGLRLFSVCTDTGTRIIFTNTADVPVLVAEGVVDLGITGSDQVIEKGVEVIEHRRLGFGKCRLSVAVHKDVPYRTAQDLSGRVVGAKFVRLARGYFEREGVVEKAKTQSVIDSLQQIGCVANLEIELRHARL